MVGFLVNFNVLRLKDGIRQFVKAFPDPRRVSANSAVGISAKEER